MSRNERKDTKMKSQYKELPNNFYELDGLSQLLECQCEDCLDILKTQDTWHLSENWDPNDAVDQIRPYKDKIVGYSYHEESLTLPGNLGDIKPNYKWLLTIH